MIRTRKQKRNRKRLSRKHKRGGSNIVEETFKFMKVNGGYEIYNLIIDSNKQIHIDLISSTIYQSSALPKKIYSGQLNDNSLKNAMIIIKPLRFLTENVGSSFWYQYFPEKFMYFIGQEIESNNSNRTMAEENESFREFWKSMENEYMPKLKAKAFFYNGTKYGRASNGNVFDLNTKTVIGEYTGTFEDKTDLNKIIFYDSDSEEDEFN